MFRAINLVSISSQDRSQAWDDVGGKCYSQGSMASKEAGMIVLFGLNRSLQDNFKDAHGDEPGVEFCLWNRTVSRLMDRENSKFRLGEARVIERVST